MAFTMLYYYGTNSYVLIGARVLSELLIQASKENLGTPVQCVSD